MFPIYFSTFLYSGAYKSKAKNPVTNPPRCPSHEIDFSPVISGLGKHTTIDNYYCQGKVYVFICMPLKKTKLKHIN
jgi:hypothetical protein